MAPIAMRVAIFGLFKTGTTALHLRLGESMPDVRREFEPTLFTPRPSDRHTGVLAKTIVRPPDESAPAVDYAAFESFEKLIYLVRDPRDWLVSALLFIPQEGAWKPPRSDRMLALLEQKETDPGSIGMTEIADRTSIELEGFTPHLDALLGLLPPRDDHRRIVFRYEDMVAGRFDALSRHLGFEVSAADPHVPAQFAHVPRQRSAGGWRDWLTPLDVERLRPRFDPYLERLGYDPTDWEPNPVQRIDPEHCSGYVARTLELRYARERRRRQIRNFRSVARSNPMRFEESQLVPLAGSDPPPGPVLVLAPHPDDETFGVGGILALHRERGDAVRVIFLTSGDAGVTSASASPGQALVAEREAEATRALACLGIDDFSFWRQPDRGLTPTALVPLIGPELAAGPATVYVTAPSDPHPDHRAAALGLREAVRIGGARPMVGFYEVGAPAEINTLIDVTAVSDARAAAIDAYAGQTEGEYGYREAVEGLSMYRALPLKRPATHAEGLRLVPAAELDIDPIWAHAALQERGVRPASPEPPSISVIVRTRNRPDQLAEALASLRDQTISGFEVVLVNDGGDDPGEILARFAELDLTRVELDGVGADRALQAGVEAARGELIAYLDDDDIYLPDHLEQLREALVRHPALAGAYTDAYAARWGLAPPGGESPLLGREVELSQDFDPELLLYRNYIPLICLMHRRSAWEQAGGFDPEMALLGDWDFLIRLSRVGSLLHIAAPTAEYRSRSDLPGVTADPANGEEIQRMHERIYGRWAEHRSPERAGRVFDRVFSELAEQRRRSAAAGPAQARPGPQLSPAAAGEAGDHGPGSGSDGPAPSHQAERIAELERRLGRQRRLLDAVERTRVWRLRRRALQIRRYAERLYALVRRG